MKIIAFANRYDLSRGEGPHVLVLPERAQDWYGRDPFEQIAVEGISGNLVIPPQGTDDGHNLVRDSVFNETLRVDGMVPLSPLFVKDLTGRIIYTGFGPERKGNAEWEQYQPKVDENGKVVDGDINPFAPMRMFPRFCRDVEEMEGEDLLEQVFLTKFRCLEMSIGFNGMMSGTPEDEPGDGLMALIYQNANLYPYKLRLDTFYTDGWKLPQTLMVYARGENVGVNPASAKRLGEQLMAAWTGRPAGMNYADWFDALGDEERERLYYAGCTVIPTFEACNGYHVVGRNFELEDYWPGQAALGLHDIVERRGDKSPDGTILEVLEPGYVTATFVKSAKVIVSDGSGYVSPNATDPVPLLPNLNLPHQRTIDDWTATWLPTHPEHFEAPAIWGWDMITGRFLQLAGPIWDPLHYYYESVPLVISAFDRTPVSDAAPLVPVPAEMEKRFYPIVPMQGFDTFSNAEYWRRQENGVRLKSSLKFIATDDFTAGIGYHPLPMEYEFELDTFWSPEFHPLSRNQGLLTEDIDERVTPVINPRVTISMYKPTVDAPKGADWLTDESLMATSLDDPFENYPFLMRYLVMEMNINLVMGVCPTPYLGEPVFDLSLPVSGWWMENGMQLDGPLALQEVASSAYDALWDMRQEGADVVRFRHLVYRNNILLYKLSWWYGWGIPQLEEAILDMQQQNVMTQEDEFLA
jgi:hypothetical protein